MRNAVVCPGVQFAEFEAATAGNVGFFKSVVLFEREREHTMVVWTLHARALHRWLRCNREHSNRVAEKKREELGTLDGKEIGWVKPGNFDEALKGRAYVSLHPQRICSDIERFSLG